LGATLFGPRPAAPPHPAAPAAVLKPAPAAPAAPAAAATASAAAALTAIPAALGRRGRFMLPSLSRSRGVEGAAEDMARANPVQESVVAFLSARPWTR